MSSNLESFVMRLNEIFDEKGLPQRGRQAFLSKHFKVSQPSAKKWLDGINYPELGKLIEISLWGETSVEWLLTGRGSKHPIDFDLSPDLLKILDLLKNATEEQQKMALGMLEVLLKKR